MKEMKHRENMVEYNDNSRHSRLSTHMKLADLVQANYKLLPVLERMGINLGFGETRVEEACEKLEFTSDFFLLICNIHSHDDFVPQIEQLRGGSNMEMLVSYLHNSHQYYINRHIPHLKQRLGEMISSCENTHSQLLERFFSNYEHEILNHFEYEEKNVFPYIRKLIAGERSRGYSIEQFEENHSNIDEKLNDLKSIILKYLPSGCSEGLRSEVLFIIFQLEEDLQKHTIIENSILIPLVTELEKNLNNIEAR